MKLIVRERVNKIVEPIRKEYTVMLESNANVIPSYIGETKGDIIVFKADRTPVRLPIGTDGQVLVADSTTETGVRWATL